MAAVKAMHQPVVLALYGAGRLHWQRRRGSYKLTGPKLGGTFVTAISRS
jgi:hypothetical protein